MFLFFILIFLTLPTAFTWMKKYTNIHITLTTFGQMLLALRYVHYRFSALIAFARTQPLKLKWIDEDSIYIFLSYSILPQSLVSRLWYRVSNQHEAHALSIRGSALLLEIIGTAVRYRSNSWSHGSIVPEGWRRFANSAHCETMSPRVLNFQPCSNIHHNA